MFHLRPFVLIKRIVLIFLLMGLSLSGKATDRRPFVFRHGLLRAEQTNKQPPTLKKTPVNTAAKASKRRAIVKRANTQIDTRYRSQHALIRAIYKNQSTVLLDQSTHHSLNPHAKLGDLVVFSSGNDRILGVITHLNGRKAEFVYLMDGWVRRGYLHRQIFRRRLNGKIINSYLRPKSVSEKDSTKHLAAELFLGYVSIE